MPTASVRARRTTLLIVAALFFIGCKAGSASSVRVETEGMTACSITAWPADPDSRRGLRSRQALAIRRVRRGGIHPTARRQAEL